MAIARSQRQLLIWTVPAIAVIIGFFWYRRKKTLLRSDPGGTALQKISEQGDRPVDSSNLNYINSEEVSGITEKAKRAVASTENVKCNIETSGVHKEIAKEEIECINKHNNTIKVENSFYEKVPSTLNSNILESVPIEDSVVVSSNQILSLPIPDKQKIIKSDLDNIVDRVVLNKQIANKVDTPLSDLDNFNIVKSSVTENNDIKSSKQDNLNSTIAELPLRDTNKIENSILSKSVNDKEEVVEENKEGCETWDKVILNDSNDNNEIIESPVKSDKITKSGRLKKRVNKKKLSDNEKNISVNGSVIDVKDIESQMKQDKISKVTSPNHLNTNSVKVSNNNNYNIEIISKTEDKIKEKKVIINTDCNKVEKLRNTKSPKTNDNKKMELTCVEVEQLGHNSMSSTINGNEAGLEQKFSNILDSSHNTEGGERDSANHSPAEVMLGSPSISNFSDAHSEESSDSGKGCSDIPTPAGGSSVAGDLIPSVYEFIIPQHMVGRLIGRHGAFLHDIRSKTHTYIFIKKHPDTIKLKICAIEGAQQDIDAALALIRQKFPIRRFPNLTLEKVKFVNFMPNLCPFPTEQLQLIEGVNNDVILSSLIKAGHFFLQQPTHPTYQSLLELNMVMNSVYNSPEAPPLDTIAKDAVCVAPAMGGWYRAHLIDVDEVNNNADVRFLDYGGYQTLETSALRKIRYDFMTLPFQAIECILANVVPAGGEDAEWSEEARLFVQDLTCGQILQAYIAAFSETGMPMVLLYALYGGQVVVVNDELVNRGYAEAYCLPQFVEENE